jgi:NADPH-dependent curcumin reductase CurA
MNPDSNTQIRLAARPDGEPERSDFDVVERPVPAPDNNEVLIRTRFMSVDPYMRLKMRESWPLGDVMPAGAVGEVVESRADGFEAGDVVTGTGWLQELEWAEYTVAAPSEIRHVETGPAPVSTALGVLGMPGRTAYFGLLDVGRPKPGDTVFVSGAAGAVGSVAGQIASLAGCRVVGTAGSEEKVSWVTDELGFDAAVNYRAVDDIDGAIESVCPDGVDVYFDNVGGEITDAVVGASNQNARIAVCGQIAHYNATEVPTGPRILPRLRHARIEDFTVRDFAHRYAEADERLIEWITADEIAYRETVTDGIENAPDAFIGLFEGENIGKQLIKVT